jgi:hypothetical protein
MALAAMYESDGQTVRDAGAPVLWGEPGDWDAIIVNTRQRLAACYAIVGELGTPTWTRGTTDDLGSPDGFFVSHVTDLRNDVWDLQDWLGQTRATWSTPTLAPRYASGGEEINATTFTDARDVRILNEVLNALDGIEIALGIGLAAPQNARVEVLGVKVGA